MKFGVIYWQGKPLYYEPFNHGYRAHFVGSETPVGISDELRAAIEADVAKQARKREGKE